MEDCASKSCIGTPQVSLLRIYVYINRNAGDMTERARHARACRDTRSLMTGAVRFTEQLSLLTDCGR